MKEFEEETVVVKKIKAVYCNKCGLGIAFGDQLFEFKSVGSYSSSHEFGKIVEFDLCESCVKKIIRKFKLEVTENL